MAGCTLITRRQKDAAATVDLGFGFIPKNCKRNDIVPVLISQQED